MNSIVVVDDDIRLCRMLQRYLVEAGYAVATYQDGESMLASLQHQVPDLILLDLNLPGTHGFELARQVRKYSDAVAIIILTGSHDSVDKVVGLELGADDYVEKPFDQRELLARIRSVLRRTQSAEDVKPGARAHARFLGWDVDFIAHRVTNPDGEPIYLTAHEYDLLVILLHNAGEVLSRDRILDEIYGREWFQSDRSVDILVSKLRRKLGDNADDPQIIKTVRGSGYILTASVELES